MAYDLKPVKPKFTQCPSGNDNPFASNELAEFASPLFVLAPA